MTDVETDTPLARLFAMGYRYLVERLHERLRVRGWNDVRAAYGFVLLAARDAATSATELATLLGTTKQAASKLAAAMVDAGYLEQDGGSSDGRRRPLRLSPRGHSLLADVEDIYCELDAEWASVIGTQELERVRRQLGTVLAVSHGGRLPAVQPGPA